MYFWRSLWARRRFTPTKEDAQLSKELPQQLAEEDDAVDELVADKSARACACTALRPEDKGLAPARRECELLEPLKGTLEYTMGGILR